MKKIYLTLFIFLLVSFDTAFAQSDTFKYTGALQTFTVPACVTSITIDARGAQGGGAAGGLGAKMTGTFTVTSGEVLNILVGGQGGPSIGQGAGGGGGSFVVDTANNTPLIVAGGGGGQGSSGAGNPGNITVTGSNGTQAISGGLGGTNGGGGGGASDNGSCISGGGGGGFCGNGGEASNGGTPGAGGIGCFNGANGSSGTLCATGVGLSYLNGGAGGVGCNTGGCSPVDGGYGGGGGTAGGGGAGGGGYSGGGGGGWNSGTPSGGGGGGSYNSGTSQNDSTGFQPGNGQVTISWKQSSGVGYSSIGSTGANCYGDSNGTATITPSGGVSPYTYLWKPSAQTNQTATGLSAGTYTVTITDAAGCSASESIVVTQPALINIVASSIPADSACTGENVTLNASGANSYLWSTGSTNTSITVIIPAGDTAYYKVEGFVGGCNNSASLKIKIIPPVTASIKAIHDTVCPNGTTTITINSAGGQALYKWSNGATTSSITVQDTITTTYTATVYGLCDSVKKTLNVVVIPLPKPVIGGKIWACKGTKANLIVSSSTNPTKYVWYNGATTSSINTGIINADSIVYVTAYNSLGCPVTVYDTVLLRAPPAAKANTSGVFCAGQPLTLTASATGVGAPFTYTWSTGQTGSTITINPGPDSTTTYTVTVSNGCTKTAITTAIPTVPVLNACCNQTILIENDTTILVAGGNSTKYTWEENPDKGTITCLNPPLCDSVRVITPVTTTYTVVGTDTSGCQAEQILLVSIDIPCFNVNVPNVFTPDNAGPLGLNNVFYIRTENTGAWSLSIFDRWGKEMYNSTNPTQYWNGNTESGAKAPAGVYYYIINTTCQNNTYKKQGFLQLIR